MRILYFYQYFGTPKGGWSTRVYEMTRRWVDEGAKVTVVTQLYDKSDLKATGLVSRQNIDGIDVLVVNIKQSSKHSIFYRIYTFILFALISSWYGIILKYDVMVASSGPITIGIPALVSRFFRRKPLVFEVRDMWPWGAISMGMLNNPLLKKLSWWMEGTCYKSSKAIVALSKGMAENIKSRYPKSNIAVVPNASDIELFSNPKFRVQLPEWAASKKMFIYTGSLGAMDNCIQILRGAKELKAMGREDIIIVLMGEGKEKAELEAYARENQLSNVHFTGLKPKEEVVGWLQQAVASFVTFKNIPVWNTCSPNKMFDSFAAGIPVIQVTQGWIKELFDKENCGINCPQEDPQALAQAIITMADNPALREEKAQRARYVALEYFNRDKLAHTMLETIKEAANKKP